MDKHCRFPSLACFIILLLSCPYPISHSKHVQLATSWSLSARQTHPEEEERRDEKSACLGNRVSVSSDANKSTAFLSSSHDWRHLRILLSSCRQSVIVSRYVVVDQHGEGDYRTIQEAVDAVPEYNSRWVYIQINAGIYVEKVTISYNKPFIIFQGAGPTSTVISWSDSANVLGTASSATFTANAASFLARGLGFRNAAPAAPPGESGGQAVAALLAGDMMAFYDCGFYGAQDTLFDYDGRHYFNGCYIEGSIDFIFGHGQSTYMNCQIVVKARPGYVSGSITAQNRGDPRDGSGFVFVGCNITGTGEVFLGRAWGAFSRVVFLYTYMGPVIAPQGWYDWGNSTRQKTVYYGQYKCYGPGADLTKRVPWSHQLTNAEAQAFMDVSFIDGGNWLQET